MERKKGLDISYHQGDIDFEAAKASGVSFIIPRDGWGEDHLDPGFINYVNEALAAGVSVPGVYHFIYASTIDEVRQNAEQAIRNVRSAGLPKTTVIWCDLEYDTVDNARDYRGVNLTKQMIRDFTSTFCDTVLAAGYPTGFYSNQDYMSSIYGEDFLNKYDLWLADLEGEASYDCVYRQTGWYARFPGVSGDVDTDEYYGQYTAGTARPGKGDNMIKASELLEQIHDVVDNIPTVYEQGSGWGAWNGYAFRLDCIIFVKCMVFWGWYKPDKTAAHGGAYYDASYDWTEAGILNHCSDIKNTNFLAAVPCEYLYMNGHGGFKIDEFTRNGKTYNVAECTVASAWGAPRKCIYSYVDDNGYRYDYKGGTQSGRWTAYGKLPKVEYDLSNESNTDNETTKGTVIDMDTFISFLPWIRKGDESDYVVLLQKCLKSLGYYTDVIDGSAGSNTDKAMKAFQKDAGLYPDGVFGPKSWKHLLVG